MQLVNIANFTFYEVLKLGVFFFKKSSFLKIALLNSVHKWHCFFRYFRFYCSNWNPKYMYYIKNKLIILFFWCSAKKMSWNQNYLKKVSKKFLQQLKYDTYTLFQRLFFSVSHRQSLWICFIIDTLFSFALYSSLFPRWVICWYKCKNEHKNKCWETNKVGKQNGLSDVEEDSLKYYILYMASVNHLLSVVAVRGFSGQLLKKWLPKQV